MGVSTTYGTLERRDRQFSDVGREKERALKIHFATYSEGGKLLFSSWSSELRAFGRSPCTPTSPLRSRWCGQHGEEVQQETAQQFRRQRRGSEIKESFKSKKELREGPSPRRVRGSLATVTAVTAATDMEAGKQTISALRGEMEKRMNGAGGARPRRRATRTGRQAAGRVRNNRG